MPAPLDPAAAGVASLLKSLRTRAGLQEERLTGTELPLDVLAELDRVRELREEGESVQQAIVRAVRTAASSLEPTMSIVADVSLCLRLSADAVSDPLLYANDLGHRRNALLRNWAALHELRSVSPPPDRPTPRALRLEVETVALGALATALTAGEPTGLAKTRSAGPGDLTSPPGQPDADVDGGRPRGPGAMGQPPLLYRVFHDVARALRMRMIRTAAGEPAGWPQDLRSVSPSATPQATAYGLMALLALDGHLAPGLAPAVRHLRSMALPTGGYATRNQAAARPEVTARVLEALHFVDGTTDLSADLSSLEQMIGDFEKHRPYILCTVLECLAQVAPESGFTETVAGDLLAARARYGQYRVWPEKVIDADPLAAAASVIHTSRAVRVLAQLQQVRPDAEVQAAIDDARDWLIAQSAFENVGEIIDRPVSDGIERTYIRHFTAAWVVQALVSAGLPASHPAVSAAVAQVWRRYSHQISLWTYRNGDVPIWMSADAIDALRLAALASMRAGRTREDNGVSFK
jgi:hypothetical protein